MTASVVPSGEGKRKNTYFSSLNNDELKNIEMCPPYVTLYICTMRFYARFDIELKCYETYYIPEHRLFY